MLKTGPKFWLVCIFLSSFQVAFSNAAVLALSTMQDCATSPDCVALEKEAFEPAVTTSTNAGVSTTVTDSSGASANAASDSVTVTDTGSGSGLRNGAWYYWSPSQNQQAQQLAQQKYCTANPSDSVCVPPFKGGQCSVDYYVTAHYDSDTGFVGNETLYVRGAPILGATVIYPPNSGSFLWVLLVGDSYRQIGGGDISRPNQHPTDSIVSVARVDGQPDNCGDPPPPDWKDWPLAKRIAAVALLSPADWENLITSMPQGGTLAPGDTINSPKIVIPGTDDPNAPDYQRLPQTIDGPYPWSGQAPSPDPDPLQGNPNNLSLNPNQLKALQEHPNYAAYLRNNNPQQDPNNQCISAPVPGHLGTAQDAPPALYATQVSNSLDDYFVLSYSGAASTFDGLTPGTQHLWEAKYGNRQLLIYDPSAPDPTVEDRVSLILYQALEENTVAQECQYQLTWAFSDQDVANFFGGNWEGNAAYPQDVQYIPYTGS